jgi:hypothetical protein
MNVERSIEFRPHASGSADAGPASRPSPRMSALVRTRRRDAMGEMQKWMRFSSVLLLMALAMGLRLAVRAGPLQTNEVARADFLQFFDGSFLHGRLAAIDIKGGVCWEHPVAKKPIAFRPENIENIRFEGTGFDMSHFRPTCRFRFQNGDELYGNLVSLDPESVSIQTWFGGPWKTPRGALQAITFLPKNFSILYEGPTGLDGWNAGTQTNRWEYRNGSFTVDDIATLGRDFKLTGSSLVEFDLAWTGSFSLVVNLYTDTYGQLNYSSSGYMFYFNPTYINLVRVQSGAGIFNLGQGQIAGMTRKSQMHLEIRTEKEEGTLSLYADGVLVQRWKDKEGLAARGTGLVFANQMEGPTLRISNLKIAQWSGKFGVDEPPTNTTPSDIVYLVNKDKASGNLRDLREDKLELAAGQNTFQIPMSRVTQIFFGAKRTPPVAQGPWAVRAFFNGGGSVSFDLHSWNRQSVTGLSPYFGPTSFNANAILQMQFHPERPRVATIETAQTNDLEWEFE